MCPECSTTFTPGDPTTTAENWFASRHNQLWMNPPGRPLLIMTAIAAISGITMLSAPGGGGVLLWMASAMFALFVAAMWALRFAIALTLQWTSQGPRNDIRRFWKRWLFTPALFAVVLALAETDVLHRLRFELSRPQFIAAASTAPPYRIIFNRTIGLYHVGDIEKLPDGSTQYSLPRYGFFDSISLVHAPNGPPAPQLRPAHDESCAPDWYVRTQPF